MSTETLEEGGALLTGRDGGCQESTGKAKATLARGRRRPDGAQRYGDLRHRYLDIWPGCFWIDLGTEATM